MNTLEADFKIVTPLFMSGAEQNIAELRPHSIKGVIRFWWRALACSRFKGDLDALAEREAELFGSAERVASFIIRVSTRSRSIVMEKNTVHQSFRTMAGARYLGYGLMDAFDGQNTVAGKLQRPCINHNQHFKVDFSSKNEIPQEFIDAVKLVGLLGGLGSRSRKGFGSLTLDKLILDKQSIWANPVNEDSCKNTLVALLNGKNDIAEEPAFSAFSQLTRIDCLLTGNDPIQLLNTFGLQMQRYRSWGNNGKVNSEDSEQNFKPDHQWFKRLDGYRESDYHPQRVVFGLPHSYSKYAEGSVSAETHDRRASPLIIHIHEYTSKSYCLISLILRAKFLPDGEKISAGTKSVPQNIEWDILDNFLDGYVGHRDDKTKTPYFPKKDNWFGAKV